MINLDKFGKFLKNRRESIKLTQIEASNLMDINKSTLWRLENGYISPSFETILKISKVYKINTNDIIEQLNNDPLYSFYNYENFLFEELALNTNNSTKEYANVIIDIGENSSNKYIKSMSEQYYYFLIGVDYYRMNDYEAAINNYIKALKINIKDFNINDIYAFSYTNAELRILMNLSTAYYYVGNYELYGYILNFCNEAVDMFSSLYIHVKYSYSLFLNRKNEYLNALNIIDDLIIHCRKEKNFSFLPMIFYQKSVCHGNLMEKESEIKYREFSKSLCIAFGYNNLLDTINSKIEKFGV